jgi:DHA3 family macrolide efflux protein-like MFS transporter
MLPYLLIGPYAGVIADRLDRKRIMMLSDLSSATALVTFALVVEVSHGKPPAWTLLLIPFALSTMRCFFTPAKSASIPNLVPSELLIQANALSNSTFNIVGLMGLALAAGVIAQLYDRSPLNFFALLLMVNALSFAGSALFVAKLPSIVPDREHEEEKHPLDDFKSGLRYIRGRRDIKIFIILLTAFRFGVAPFFVVYVAANKEWFGGRPQTLMWFEFTFFAGMIIGSLIAARMRVRRPTMLFSWELLLLGVLIAPMAIPWLGLFVALNFICGFIVAAGDIPMTTYLQASVEDAYRGRVNSVKEMVTTGVMPLSMAGAGLFLNRFGLQGSFVLMGAVMAIAGAAGFIDRKYREVQMPAEVYDKPTGALPDGAAA